MAVQSNASDIHLRSSQAMNLRSTDPFTVCTWINATWNSGTCLSCVGICGPSSDTPLGAPTTAVQIGSASGNYDLTCWSWGGSNLVSTAAGAMTGFNGVWVFICYAYDGTVHSLYRNGELLQTTTNAQTAGFLNQVYINGYPGSGTGEVGSFQVDQYSLFRRALSAGEVLTMYNARGDRHGIYKDLIARYGFDELGQGAAASSVIDMSGNNHTLTVTGAGSPFTYTYPNTVANSNIRPVL